MSLRATVVPIALALLAAAPPAALAGGQDPSILTWKGRDWTLDEASSQLPDLARAELGAWGGWCRTRGYRALLDEEARVLFVGAAGRKDLAGLFERARRTTETFDALAPAPERDPDEPFLVPDWGRGQHVPDRDPVVIALLEAEPDFESLLGLLASSNPALNGRVLRKKGTPAFFSAEARTGALLSAPDGFELGTVWRAENELVNRLTRLLLHRRFGDLPFWLDMGLAWHVEQEVQGDLYSFPGRDEFVSVNDHDGWKNDLKREFKKRRKEPLRLEELAGWTSERWDGHAAGLAWGFARFLATHPERPLSRLCEDLRLDVKRNGVRYAEDGSWSLVPDYRPTLETQHALLARHLGDDYLERASEYFRTWKH